MKQISIIGAGVAGLWTAILAHQHHYKVTIYEQDDESLTQGCSYRAGGMLAFNCEADSKNDIITSLGQQSLVLWQKFFPKLITQNGSLLLTYPQDKDQLRYFEKTTLNYHNLDQNTINTLEPALESRFGHGLYFYNEAHLEPRLCLTALRDYCQGLGIEIHFNTKITAPMPNTITIHTTGLWGQQDLTSLRSVKGEMIIVKCPDLTLTRPVRLLHPHHPIYIVPRPDNHYMIGATTIETQGQSHHNFISVQSAGTLLTQAFNIHPAFGEAEIIEMNVGYRPAFADNKPQIIEKQGIYYLNGLYRHGWTIAPALANELMQKIQIISL
ncbi:MAG: glycine oxidase [Alphaproteobacteria bacterium]|jgi:glycine oxidase